MVSFINVENAAFIVIPVIKNLFMFLLIIHVFNYKMCVSKVFEFTSYSQVMRSLTSVIYYHCVFRLCSLFIMIVVLWVRNFINNFIIIIIILF